MGYSYMVGKQGDYVDPAHVQVYDGRDMFEAMHEFWLAVQEGDEYVVFEALRDKEG